MSAGPGDTIPTIRVVHSKIPGEYMVINIQDFDPAKHTLWQEQTEEAMELMRNLALEAVAQGEATKEEVAHLDNLTSVPDPTPREPSPEFDEGDAEAAPATPQNELGLGARHEVDADPENQQGPAEGIRRGRRSAR